MTALKYIKLYTNENKKIFANIYLKSLNYFVT